MTRNCLIILVALLIGVGAAQGEVQPRGLLARWSQVVDVTGHPRAGSEGLSSTLYDIKGEMLSHDDGSFEDALGIYSTKPGSVPCDSTFAVANSFFVQETCSLQAIFVHFDYRTDRDFYLWIWEDLGGTPVYQDCQAEGPDSGSLGWWRIDLDPFVVVSDTFWIGVGYSFLWIEPEWYIGFDTDTPDTHAAIDIWGAPDGWNNLCQAYGYCHAFGIRAVKYDPLTYDHEVGCVSIDVPGPTVCPATPCAPKATVINNGSYVEVVDVTMSIEPGGYQNVQTVAVDAVEGNNTTQVTFDPWFTGDEGSAYTITAYTTLVGDEDPDNDTTYGETEVSSWQKYDDDSFEEEGGLTGALDPVPANRTMGFATMFTLQCEEQRFFVDTVAIWFDDFVDDDFRLYVWSNDRTCEDLPQPRSHDNLLYVDMDAPAPPGTDTWATYEVCVEVTDTFWVGVCYNRLAGLHTWTVGIDMNTADNHTMVNATGERCAWTPAQNNAYGIKIHKIQANPQFIRGDVQADNDTDMFDAIYILNWLGGISPPPKCVNSCDLQDDEDTDLFDAIYMLNWLGGIAPAPGPPCCASPGDCGPDPTFGPLTCESFPPCNWSPPCNPIPLRAEIKDKTVVVGSPESSWLEVGQARIDEGTVSVPVLLTNAEALLGFRFTMEYDPDLLDARWVDNTGLSTEGFDFFVGGTGEPGKVTVVALSDIEMGDGVDRLPAGAHQVARVVFESRRPLDRDVLLALTEGVMAIDDDRALSHRLVNGLIRATGQALVPIVFSLAQNCPNPFNPETEIRYGVPTECQVAIEVYNVLGQLVITLVDEQQEAGYKAITWDGRDQQGHEAASGIYLFQLRAGEMRATKKAVLLR